MTFQKNSFWINFFGFIGNDRDEKLKQSMINNEELKKIIELKNKEIEEFKQKLNK